ncbi:unnamed protein product [Microthlaspi erraticum]|uniref:Uncharacterized protein n=1 Tax=Microthlaspi erraticum TaxID=1685480 RepID=A0A6D2JSN5_9BRAS|nr:unnamed protein product [Microthlaspi erraticum]
MDAVEQGRNSESKKLAMDAVEQGRSGDSKKLAMVGNQSQSPGGLVYVRRKVEVDANKAKEAPTREVARWEERYHQLQMLLNKLDSQSHQTDHHVQMLWSLSAAELSKHAVDLEKRSIHLSLEEAREMQRVSALNVLGRSVNSLKSTPKEGD